MSILSGSRFLLDRSCSRYILVSHLGASPRPAGIPLPVSSPLLLSLSDIFLRRVTRTSSLIMVGQLGLRNIGSREQLLGSQAAPTLLALGSPSGKRPRHAALRMARED